MDDLLKSQMDYYRARASEYDEWFYRMGRYDHGEDENAQWFAEADIVRQTLLKHPPVERALELASGTGIWTEALVNIADHITALDASSEVQAISQQKLPEANITYEQVDLFNWQPQSTYDLVFFGFWVSHVPAEKLDAFLAKVAAATKPGGTLFIVDSRLAPKSSAKNHSIPTQGDTTHLRKLNDGREFTIVKIFYKPAELEAMLHRHGFDAIVRVTDNYFIYVEATRMSDSKSLSKQRYTEHAASYITSQTHAKGTELDRLVEIAQPQPDWLVLDVATGGGHTALKFAPHVSKVIATDLTPHMLEKAREFISRQGVENVEFKEADAENLPFDDAMFDLVTCRIAPHHFPDAFKFVQESARVLKPGGLLLVQDHVLPDDERAADYVDAFEKLRDPSHHHAFAEYAWRGMFLDAGLTIEHTEQLTKRHEFVSWAERQGCSPEVVAKLTVMLKQAPELAVKWMDAQAIGTPEASFINHHIIIAGRK